MKIGERVRFQTTGWGCGCPIFPNPPATAEGIVNGPIVLNSMVHGGGYVPLWCEREGREPTTIYVCLGHIVEGTS